jgi:tetratricopeptide (TPR) repeat protein
MKRALILLVLLGIGPDSGDDWMSDGNRAYSEKRFGDALEAYTRALRASPARVEALYNAGDALYRMGRYAEAGTAFEGASKFARSDSLAGRCFYNYGNALFQQAVSAIAVNDPRAPILLEQSLRAYAAALNDQRGWSDALHNEEVVRRLLENLRKPPPQARAPDAAPPPTGPDRSQEILNREMERKQRRALDRPKTASAEKDW